MGIKELLRRTKIETRKHLSEYKNQKIAIDAYSWLHKAMYCANEDLLTKNNITPIFNYFRSKLNKLFSYSISVVLVFDGDNLKLKAMTETNRDENRKKVLEKIEVFKKAGNEKEARKLISQAIDVTPEMACCIKQRLQLEFPFNLEFIVSPYEADSQLAYLSKINYVDLIITEDSDLLIFGGKRMFYKMDNEYYGDEIKLCDLEKCQNYDFKNWTSDEIISFAILCGCDYLDSPKGMAFANAYKLFSKTRRIEDFLKEMEGKLEPNYFEKFVCAFLCFKYQKIYCPIEKKMKMLNEFNERDIRYKQIAFDHFKSYSFLGDMMVREVIDGIVNFKIDPITKIRFPEISRYFIKNATEVESKKRIPKKSTHEKGSLKKGNQFSFNYSKRKEDNNHQFFLEFDKLNPIDSKKITELLNAQRIDLSKIADSERKCSKSIDRFNYSKKNETVGNEPKQREFKKPNQMVVFQNVNEQESKNQKHLNSKCQDELMDFQKHNNFGFDEVNHFESKKINEILGFKQMNSPRFHENQRIDQTKINQVDKFAKMNYSEFIEFNHNDSKVKNHRTKHFQSSIENPKLASHHLIQKAKIQGELPVKTASIHFAEKIKTQKNEFHEKKDKIKKEYFADKTEKVAPLKNVQAKIMKFGFLDESPMKDIIAFKEKFRPDEIENPLKLFNSFRGI